MFAILSCYFWLAPALQQAEPSSAAAVSITIKVLNGKTGKPVWRESPNIWVDKLPHINPYTSLRGVAKIRVAGDAALLTITPDWGHECRSNGDPSAKVEISYSVTEIIRTGVVGQNFCGVARVPPTPGILVLYELPSTWRERWNS
jgi:hypothetical protein